MRWRALSNNSTGLLSTAKGSGFQLFTFLLDPSEKIPFPGKSSSGGPNVLLAALGLADQGDVCFLKAYSFQIGQILLESIVCVSFRNRLFANEGKRDFRMEDTVQRVKIVCDLSQMISLLPIPM